MLYEDLEDLKKKTNSKKLKKKIDAIQEALNDLCSKSGLCLLAKGKNVEKALKTVRYEEDLVKLQVELIKLQNWVFENKKRVLVIFEGRDAAGKGGAIKRFTERLNPRRYRVVALPKPTEVEAGQFYFQRYFAHLPNPGEIVFFDRSWYNRAIVEPAFGFCTEEQYDKFMQEVPEIEHALIDDGIIMIKFWFSISKKEQQKRFKERQLNPLKQWKLSPVDMKAQKMWDKITFYKEEMFSRTHTTFSPWIIVKSNDKKSARLESIRYVLSHIPYEGKEDAGTTLHPDPEIVQRYHRKSKQID
ncbi:polyphosphate kinase 2 [Hydrogenimonas cancrithermarum]|uniref:ADP/GDP-polyphosphate phosphotransferase n=1 Tax=Hydrogenimonas cancrithermarum TaxID=2993563 RepID=A0ABN6WS05_9BACT|nr:polyphosphate kinase 2 [Hydrogenimonas cancrithermarum]BDY11788.1 polyphosphate kinase 2 [Hydrogenimonas cancrithermarum]